MSSVTIHVLIFLCAGFMIIVPGKLVCVMCFTGHTLLLADVDPYLAKYVHGTNNSYIHVNNLY